MEYLHKMASSINPYNINGNFPIAGQDNDSQGFRDNFTNTRNNLVFTKSEIEDLQSRVLLKRPLSGGSSSDPNFNELNGTRLSGAQLKGWYETEARHRPAGSNVSLNLDTANFYNIETSGPLLLTPAGFPTGSAAGWGKIRVLIDVTDVAHTVSFPAGSLPTGIANVKGFNGTTGINFDAVGTYFFEIGSYNGNSFYIVDLSRNYVEFLTEDIASADEVSLYTTTTTFATADAETATLADGVNGQTKTLIMTSDGGDMVITVDSAGWKENSGDPAEPQSGTVTFNSVGQACQLQFINAKWYCVGNNGATFA